MCVSLAYRTVAAWPSKGTLVIVKVAAAVLVRFAQIVDRGDVAAFDLNLHHLARLSLEHRSTMILDSINADGAATGSTNYLFDSVEQRVATTGQTSGSGWGDGGAGVTRSDRQRRRTRRRSALFAALTSVHVLMDGDARQRTRRTRLMMTIAMVHVRRYLDSDGWSKTGCHLFLLFEKALIDGGDSRWRFRDESNQQPAKRPAATLWLSRN